MKPEHLEPLISRYVDGEVTEAEKTIAESMIAGDMAAKQIWSDYMAIRNSFARAAQNLPKLPVNFAETILAQLGGEQHDTSKSRRCSAAQSAGKILSRSTQRGIVFALSTAAKFRRWLPMATTAMLILVGVAVLIVKVSTQEDSPSSAQMANVQSVQSVSATQSEQRPVDVVIGEDGFRILPPPMPGTETVTTEMTPDDVVKRSQDQLLTRGIEFVCSPPTKSGSAPHVSTSMSVFETRMLILLSDKEIPWQKSTRGSTASVSYELTIPLAEMTELLSQLQAEAKKSGWNIEPATDSVDSIVASMTELPRTVKIRLRLL